MPVGTSMVDYGSLAIESALATTGVSAAQQDPRFVDIDGTGVTTVVIDTGIDLNHPFFGPDADGDGIADRILFQYDFANGDPDASDVAGHGSHVSSLIGSQDALYPGVASGTDLIALKVFEDAGSGYFSYLEQGLQWVIANREAYQIGVVNLSLGDRGNWTDTFSRYGIGDELAALAAMDVIVVGAAGNNYYQYGSLGVAYPASDPAVIAVGATWAADFGGPWRIYTGATDYSTGVDHIASFSQRDPDLLDVFAPGARFNAANATGGYRTMEGTSQAAAFVSGVAALCQQVALQELGRGLTTGEFALLLQETSDFLLDGDDEIDNVINSGLLYERINFLALAERILTLDQIPAGGGNGSGGGSGSVEMVQQAAPGVHQVTLTAGQDATEIDFGNFALGTISGTVFNDLDGDAQQDGGDPGLEGWTVFLDQNQNGALDEGEPSTVTDGIGGYAFTDLGPGTYRVREVAQSGWQQTAPVGEIYDIAMTSGLQATDQDFGNQALEGEHSPVLHEIADRTINEGMELSFTASATDPDLPDDVLTFSLAEGAPDGAAIDQASGVFTWTPMEAQGPGAYPITVRVTDSADLSDTESFTIQVNEVNLAPSLEAISDRTVDEETLVSFTAAATEPDLPANTLVFSLDEGAPDGAAIDPASGVFTWTPTEAQGSGTYSITARVTDGELEAAQTFSITVNEVNLAPGLEAISDRTVDEETLVSFTAMATDPDLPANTLVFGLDEGAPDGAAIDPASGVFTWTPTEAQDRKSVV